MKKIQRLSDTEKQIMEYIWAAGRPVTTSEIMEIIKSLPGEKIWKQNTVITFLSRMIEKGIIIATRVSKANHYEPCITEQEYRCFETKQFINDVHKGSAMGFITTLVDTGDLTKEDIEALIKKLKE